MLKRSGQYIFTYLSCPVFAALVLFVAIVAARQAPAANPERPSTGAAKQTLPGTGTNQAVPDQDVSGPRTTPPANPTPAAASPTTANYSTVGSLRFAQM